MIAEAVQQAGEGELLLALERLKQRLAAEGVFANARPLPCPPRHLLVLTSRMEGGANVISEACAAGVPILASRIEGSVGLLGEKHPGMFEVGNTRELRSLLLDAENDKSFYQKLRHASIRSARQFAPRLERAAWRALLAKLRR